MCHQGQAKTKRAVRCCYTPFRMAKPRALTAPNASEDVEQWDFSLFAGNEK